MKKLIYRLKATKSLHVARLLERAGKNNESVRLFHISRWYHEQAYLLGYDHEPFLKDFASVLEVCGNNQEAKLIFIKASAEIKTAA